jgi:ferredoxin
MGGDGISTAKDAKRDAIRAFLAEAKVEGLTLTQKLVAFFYGTAPYFWFQKNIRGPFTGRSSKEKFSQHYHGKVLTLDQAEAIINVDRDIPLRDLEQVVPYSMARNFVLQAPADIVLLECACRRALGGDCQPSQVCMVLGKPFTDWVLAEQPETSRRVTREEALEVLRRAHERGHMHTAYFKDAMLNRFYSLCNCCKDHCLGIRMMNRYNTSFLTPSGFAIRVDPETCTSCGKCVEVCPFEAVISQGSMIVNDVARCMGCGVCTGACPSNARSLVRDEKKGIPLDVREMIKEPTDQLSAPRAGATGRP